MIPTSIDGFAKYGGNRIGKCRNIRLNIAKSPLRTTTLQDYDETYVAGLRNTTGTATLFYDPEDSVAVSLLDTILEDTSEPSEVIELVLCRHRQKSISVNALLTEVGTSVAYGEAQACEITFQVSGKPTGGF